MTNMHREGWTTGMTVYVVLDDHRMGNPFKETISKIGRKWITLGDGRRQFRFDAETMRLDGGNYTSPGRVWPSEREYQENREAQKAWREFAGRLPFNVPDHLTLEDIREMKAKIWGERDASTESN